jgi:hypothetical protein
VDLQANQVQPFHPCSQPLSQQTYPQIDPQEDTDMITWVRTADIRDGKRIEAIQWALKTAIYVNKTFDLNITVQSNASGPQNQLH